MSKNTEFAAKKIAKELGADLIPLFPEKAYPDKGFKKFLWGGKSAVMGDRPELQPYSFSASDYDTVILGTPVWASCFTPPLRTFIEENRAGLQCKTLAAFLCFSGGGAEKALSKLKAFLDTDSLEAELILTDPLTKPDEANDKKILDFCNKLK